jgi:hypothetical protein
MLHQVLGLLEVTRGDKRSTGDGIHVRLRVPWFGQKMELNWYPPKSRHAAPYVPGERLDHIAFREDVMSQWLE